MAVGEPSFRALSHRHLGFLDARSGPCSGGKEGTTRSLPASARSYWFLYKKRVHSWMKIIPISCRHHLRGNTVDNGDVCCLPRVWMSRPVHFTAELPVWNNFERFLSRFLFWIWFISAPQLHTPTKDRVQQTALPACCFQNSTKNVLRRLNHYPLYQSSILSLHQASYNHQLLLLLLKGLALP